MSGDGPVTGVRPAWFWGYWAVLAVLSAAQYAWISRMAGFAVAPGVAVALGAWRMGEWALLCLGLFWLARRLPLVPGRWGRNLALAVAAVTLLAVVQAAAHSLGNAALGFPESGLGMAILLRGAAGMHIALHMLAAGYGVSYARRARERRLAAAQLEARLAETRLQALKAQLQPHFLFNTFHSISALMFRDPAAADRMLERLAGLLRRTLEHSAAQEVPLAEEVEVLRTYLEIEQTRFSDRLRTTIDVPPPLETARVPHLLLQPLVENAVRHGISRRRGPGHVEVRARAEGAQLVLEVRDDGVGLDAPSPARGTGIGLRNTRERLAQLYGNGQAMRVEPAPAGGTRVEIRVPLRHAAGTPARDEGAVGAAT